VEPPDAIAMVEFFLVAAPSRCEIRGPASGPHSDWGYFAFRIFILLFACFLCSIAFWRYLTLNHKTDNDCNF
jgi:hypothetical protein